MKPLMLSGLLVITSCGRPTPLPPSQTLAPIASPQSSTSPSKPKEKIYTDALSYFDYSTPDEWSRTLISDTDVSGSGDLTIRITNAWFALAKHEKRQMADQLVKRWAIALDVGGEKSTPRVSIVDGTGHRVGGASAWGGAWVEDE